MSRAAVLVDSTIYINEARNRRNPLRLISALAVDREMIICSMVRTEVGRGLREASVRQAFIRVWDVMRHVGTDQTLWKEVEDLAWGLDRRGIILPSTDLMIACCAARAEAVILTLDGHFSKIPGCKVARSVEELVGS